MTAREFETLCRIYQHPGLGRIETQRDHFVLRQLVDRGLLIAHRLRHGDLTYYTTPAGRALVRHALDVGERDTRVHRQLVASLRAAERKRRVIERRGWQPPFDDTSEGSRGRGE